MKDSDNMWKDILKKDPFSLSSKSTIYSGTPKEFLSGQETPAELEVELDRDALADSCCSQAKIDFIQNMHRILIDDRQERIEQVTLMVNRREEGPRKREMQRLLNQLHENRRMIGGLVDTYEHLVDTGTCEEVRNALKEISTEDDPLKEEAIRILEEWKECEGKE